MNLVTALNKRLSAIPYESRVGRILRFPLGLIPPDTAMPILRGRLRGKRWIVGSSNHGFWLGNYEYEKRVIFERTITAGSVVFDIGAHVGFYTLLASVLVGPEGKVIAFEPSPRNLVFLKDHLHLNQITNASLIEAAVADSSGGARFEESDQSDFTGHISTAGEIEVRAVSLDELIQSGEIPMPNYVKIDVEGAELLVLRGATSIMRHASPTLFLSTHGRAVHDECCTLLESLDYRLEPIAGASIEDTSELLAYRGDADKQSRATNPNQWLV